MEKIKKDYNLKISLLTICALFLFTDVLYSYPISMNYLRVPIGNKDTVERLKEKINIDRQSKIGTIDLLSDDQVRIVNQAYDLYSKDRIQKLKDMIGSNQYSLEKAVEFLTDKPTGTIVGIKDSITLEDFKNIKHSKYLFDYERKDACEIGFIRLRDTQEWIAIKGTVNDIPFGEIKRIANYLFDIWIHNHPSELELPTFGDVYNNFTSSINDESFRSLIITPEGITTFTSYTMKCLEKFFAL